MKRNLGMRCCLFALAAILWLGLPPHALPQATAPASNAQKAGQQSASQQFEFLLSERRYPELAEKLPSAGLSPLHRDYFEGVLANRQNRLPDAIRLLEKALPGLKSESPERTAQALHLLADSYVKSFHYADAIPVYADLLTNYERYLEKSERKSTEDDYKTVQLLKDAPPQTVELKEAVTIPTHRSKLGTIDMDLTLNGVTRSWIVDSGANFSVVTESLARKLALPISKEEATTQGITGAENPLHTAIIPELKIGIAVVRNAVVLVLRDSDLNIHFGRGRYQIDAILGYPVLSALGSLTFANNAIRIGPSDAASDAGAVLYMELLTPLLQCSIGGRELLFSFDTGADRSIFTVKYYKQFRDTALRGLPLKSYKLGGAGGVRQFNVYFQPLVEAHIGSRVSALKEVPVLPEPMSTDLDKLNGNLGRDLVNGFQSFTIDFTHMRFLLGEPLTTTSASTH